MESSNSDSENECFESAEESLEEDEKDESESKSQECKSELPEYVLSHDNSVKPLNPANEEIFGNIMSYRKRPERVKRLLSKPSHKTTTNSDDESVFKPEKIVSDVFLQDLTSNLSKNINRSLSTLQQTSSNVRELIFSTIPLSSQNNKKGFSYDDTNAVSISPNTFLSDRHLESTKNVEDNFEKSKKISQENMSVKEVGFLLDNENDNAENKKLASTGCNNLENNGNKLLKCDSEILVLKNIAEKESKQSLDNPDSGYLNLNKEGDVSNESETKIISCEVEHSISSNESSANIENTEFAKPIDQNHNFRMENNLTDTVKCSYTEKLEEEKLCVNKESSDEARMNEKELEEQGPEKEKIFSHVMADNSCLVQESFTDPPPNVECNKNLQEDTDNVQKENHETETKCNLNELKTVLKNIINDEKDDLENINEEKDDLENINEEKKGLETIKEDYEKEGKILDNENSKEGWDDFDFSDLEEENGTFKQDNLGKMDESEQLKNEYIKKNKMVLSDVKTTNNNFEGSDYTKSKIETLKKGSKSLQADADKFNAEGPIKVKKSLLKENSKSEISEIKPESEDAWDWDTWDEGAENSEIGADKEMAAISETKASKLEKVKENSLDISKWSGWDNFGQKSEEKPKNWSLGSWGVDMLLNKATTVTQGISSVLEAGLGAPDPETLAKMEKMEEENMKRRSKVEIETEKQSFEISKKNSLTNVNLFPVTGITSLVAEVTSKIVEHSKIQEIGSKVINGGLDTLETFGKKTMEVLQEGDPGLKNKRAILLGDQKPVLSQVLREAREKADRELKKVEERELAKKCHFETLFDDFQGMVHLEALEMLSRQYELKLEQLRHGMNSEEQEDFKSILEEVEQLCSLDEFDMDLKITSKIDFKTKLQMAVEPLKNEISIQKIIQIYEEAINWLQTTETRPSFSLIHQKLVSTLAELTAATVQQFHKSGELLSVKECRKTVEEVDALLRLTNLLCAEINTLCEKFMLFSKERNHGVNDEKVNSLSENVTIVMKNSTSYIRQAFNLLIPVLQFGAAVY